jgi:hypothetical protein
MIGDGKRGTGRTTQNVSEKIEIPEMASVLNCSVCNQLMITKASREKFRAETRKAWSSGYLVVFNNDRIRGRPLCPRCCVPKPPVGPQGTKEPSPWGENAVRAMEDGQ